MPKHAVLLAEDDPDTLSLLHWLLEHEGYDVIDAKDGGIARDILDGAPSFPDAIVTDLMMPNVSGYELIQHIRNTQRLSHLPVVAMSAYGNSYLSEAKRLGATATIQKPEGLTNVGEIVTNVISKRGH